jgi:hypothetical protein
MTFSSKYYRSESTAKKAEMLMANVDRRLRKLGYKRIFKSAHGSFYYEHKATERVVRMSEHEVPLTEARLWERKNGGRKCADREIIIDVWF